MDARRSTIDARRSTLNAKRMIAPRKVRMFAYSKALNTVNPIDFFHTKPDQWIIETNVFSNRSRKLKGSFETTFGSDISETSSKRRESADPYGTINPGKISRFSDELAGASDSRTTPTPAAIKKATIGRWIKSEQEGVCPQITQIY